MATTFYLRTANVAIATYNRFASIERGEATSTLATTTVGASTWVSIGFWASMPLRAFTLSGTVTMNVWGYESAQQANSSFGMRIYRWQYNNGSPTLSASLGQATNGTELGAGVANTALRSATVTPTSTNFSSGDIIVIEMGVTNVGTMGNGQIVTLQYNGSTANAAGDSWFSINENVTNQRPFIQVT